MSVIVRTISEEEFEKWSRSEALGFGMHASDEYIEVARSFAELDRAFAAFEGDEVVGTAITRTSSISTPGGRAVLGFVDDVSVLPTHRRRGIMTRIMRSQLDQMRERGEPLAALTSSESLIYERFGYGIATWAHWWKIDRRHTAMKLPPSAGGQLSFISPDTARDEWPKLQDRVQRRRPGMIHYSNGYWRAALYDAEEQRRGASEFFHVAYMRDGRVSGLCAYRRQERAILVMFLMGEDDEVEAELWRYCFGIDLISEIQGFIRPTDDPLPWRLEDPRRLERSLTDHFWLRLVDVRAALESRSYSESGSITFRVRDKFCEWNDGVYTLEAGPGGAKCVQSQMTPQIEMSVSDLASAYLGGVSLLTMARAGRVEENERGSLETACRMFRTERAPWSLEL